MPTKSRNTEGTKYLRALGQKIRDHRKSLGVSAVVAAEAAGMSRVTLYRIEKGEPSVAMGAYLAVATALGLTIAVLTTTDMVVAQKTTNQQIIPAFIKPADYPQLKLLAWQISGAKELTPSEALAIYERNQRHIDYEKLEPHERHLIEALRSASREQN
jgi:transcriptional regulator with XRE-family HTH domain